MYVYIYSSVGTLQKLGPYVTELNTPLTQDSEKTQEDPGKGKAAAGPAVASGREVSAGQGQYL